MHRLATAPTAATAMPESSTFAMLQHVPQLQQRGLMRLTRKKESGVERILERFADEVPVMRVHARNLDRGQEFRGRGIVTGRYAENDRLLMRASRHRR